MIPGVLHVCNEYILMDIQPSISALSFFLGDTSVNNHVT